MIKSNRISSASPKRIFYSFCFLTGGVLSSTSVFSASSLSSLTSSLSSSSSPVIISGGLRNLGNTCYLNSQLQCSFHIPKVRQLIISPPPPPSIISSQEEDEEEESSISSISSFTCTDSSTDSSSSSRSSSIALLALGKVFEEMKRNPNASVTPRILCQSLGIPVMVQQDSQEFWKLLLPELGLPALTDLYQGAFEDYITALDGSGRERKREEPFLDLSLDVSSHSVMESLQKMFGTAELLSEAEGNGWRPEKGADKVDALKGSVLHGQGLPSILQLHLKRFQYDWNTDTTSKINHRFTFPEELDLSLVCSASSSSQSSSDDCSTANSMMIYDLQSVVVHLGEYGSGHYYSYVRPDFSSPDVWYRFDDHVVTKVTFDEVVADSFGGTGREGNKNNMGGRKQSGILGSIQRALLPRAPRKKSGYGGSKSNAYVLQYVRRSDIPMLYDC